MQIVAVEQPITSTPQWQFAVVPHGTACTGSPVAATQIELGSGTQATLLFAPGAEGMGSQLTTLPDQDLAGCTAIQTDVRTVNAGDSASALPVNIGILVPPMHTASPLGASVLNVRSGGFLRDVNQKSPILAHIELRRPLNCKKRFWHTRFELLSVPFDFDRHHLEVGRNEVQLAAIPAPDGDHTAFGRDLPFAAMLGEGLDVDFVAFGFVGDIRQKADPVQWPEASAVRSITRVICRPGISTAPSQRPESESAACARHIEASNGSYRKSRHWKIP